jgi:signal transduction histidine kinase
MQRANRQLARRNEELEKALKGMREASVHKSRFLAQMSHELRSPLNSIIGFTEVICDKRAGPLTETQEEFLGDSLRSARHLLALINDILDLEKIAAGHVVLSPEPLDLHLLIEETVHELSILAAVDKKVRLSTELDERVRRVVLDRQKTKQILINLLTNAIKFTPDGGRVIVRSRAAETARCVLEVEDTGVGISEDDRARLFHEFEQLELAPSKRQQGTGLGLVLTKKLAEAQGGTIAVSSQVGVGSTFSVTLPTNLLSRNWLPRRSSSLSPSGEATFSSSTMTSTFISWRKRRCRTPASRLQPVLTENPGWPRSSIAAPQSSLWTC